MMPTAYHPWPSQDQQLEEAEQLAPEEEDILMQRFGGGWN